MAHILITTPTFPPAFDGVATSVWEYASGLRDLGHTVEIFTLGKFQGIVGGIKVTSFDIAKNLTLREFSCANVVRYISAVRNSGAGLLIAHTAQSLISDLALLVFIGKKIYHSHGVSWKSGSQRGSLHSIVRKLNYLPYRLIGPAVLRRANTAILLGNDCYNDRTFDQSYFADRPVHIIPNGSSFPIVKQRIRPRKPITILTVAVCTKEKGFKQLANLICKEKFINVSQFHICTTSDSPFLSEFKNIIARNGKNNVQFLFNKTGRDLHKFYLSSDVLMNLSETECFPLIMADAQNVRLPTFCFDTGYQKQIGGAIVRDNVDDIASALRCADLVDLLVEKSKQCVPRTWASCVEELDRTVIKPLLGKTY